MATNCSKKPTEKQLLTVDRVEMIFSKQGENSDFYISCNGEWGITADSIKIAMGANEAEVLDFTVTPYYGKGNAKVSVILRNEIVENYDVDLKIIGKDNQATVRLKAIAGQTSEQ
ncbi:MAG: hypothetical protein LBG92_10580 [Prevotellaceae bacterium]|nr:hypothetical protein [Prevotellaceae bacterium]